MAKTLSYAHPVLGNGDDFSIEWAIETYDERISPSDDSNSPVTRIVIDCVKTGEEAIDNLLASGDVGLFLEVKCLNTCFRRWFPVLVDEDHGQVEIQSDSLQGTVKLDLTLEAMNDIDEYMPSAISEFYPTGRPFALKRGDIIAKHEAEFSVGELYIEKKFNSVSWIKYRLSQETAPEPQVDYSGSDVIIDLPSAHFQFIREGADKIDSLIRCMYIAPVLANCIEKVRQADRDDNTSDIAGCDWVESLKTQLVLLNSNDDDDAVVIAWNILHGSLHGAIEEINSYIEEE